MVYQVSFTQSAAKALRRLDRATRDRVAEVIDRLSDNPRPPGSKKLKGGDGVHRVRVGEYRVLYQIKDRQLTILVVAVGHRREVYR